VTLILLAIVAFLLALLPMLLYAANRRLFVTPDSSAEGDSAVPSVSVLIPARDEEAGIRACVEAALSSQKVTLEVVVMDDQSQDATAEIVQGIAEQDHRVRLVPGVPLPAGWNGKQHACWQLAKRATHPYLVFLDADVRLQPDALRRMVDYASQHNVALLSAFPRQETGTLLEKLLIPMMHVVLLCFLPLRRMRASSSPAYAAGCGQFFLTTQAAYQQAGTHASLRGSRHDGIKLPRAFRAAGLMTDVVDGTPLAACRMYRSGGEVIRGLLKNADEGIANARLIIPFSVLLLGGTVLPIVVMGLAVYEPSPLAFGLATLALVIGWLPRWANVGWLRQSPLGAALHPLAVVFFLLLQWTALAMSLSGRRVRWRGRT